MITMAKGAMLFDFQNMIFKNIKTEVANKKLLSAKLDIMWIETSCKNGVTCYGYNILYPRLLHRENFVSCEDKYVENHIKLLFNTSTWNF